MESVLITKQLMTSLMETVSFVSPQPQCSTTSHLHCTVNYSVGVFFLRMAVYLRLIHLEDYVEEVQVGVVMPQFENREHKVITHE